VRPGTFYFRAESGLSISEGVSFVTNAYRWFIDSTFLILICILLPSNIAHSRGKMGLKVAILDNLQSQKLASEKYQRDYLIGIEHAIRIAKTKGYHVTVKSFFYGKGALDILTEVPKIKAWGSDLVIGPRSSNKFLLLKEQFDNVMVLSPLATAATVAELPRNFYSLTLPNEYAAHAMAAFSKNQFKGRRVFKVIEADCKSCTDFSEIFERYVLNGQGVLPGTTFTQDQVESISMEALLKNYRLGDLILLPNTSYASGILMARITENLKSKSVIFLGSDDWGSWTAGYVGKVHSSYPYQGYRVIPWSLDIHNPSLDGFKRSFIAAIKTPVPDEITFVAYQVLMSAIAALEKFGNSKPITAASVLETYLKALKYDPNWFRPKVYAVYKRSQNGESFFGTVNNSNGKIK
jgi:hypothetical protein